MGILESDFLDSLRESSRCYSYHLGSMWGDSVITSWYIIRLSRLTVKALISVSDRGFKRPDRSGNSPRKISVNMSFLITRLPPWPLWICSLCSMQVQVMIKFRSNMKYQKSILCVWFWIKTVEERWSIIFTTFKSPPHIRIMIQLVMLFIR